jgi:hypothetical protein
MIREALNINQFVVHISSTGHAVLVSGRLHLYAEVFVTFGAYTTMITDNICNDVILVTINEFLPGKVVMKTFRYVRDVPNYNV